MAMRDEIKKAIEEGGATKESLLNLTGTTDKGLASQFTYMRMTGTFPIKGEDGVYKLIDKEEWDAIKAETASKGPAKVLTLDEKIKRAENRSKRATSAYDNAKKKKDALVEANEDVDKLTELKLIKADAELQISEIELGKLEQEKLEAPEHNEDAEIPEDATDDGEGMGDFQ